MNHLVVAACGLECPRNKWWLNHLLRLLDRLLSIECGTRVARDGSGAYGTLLCCAAAVKLRAFPQSRT